MCYIGFDGTCEVWNEAEQKARKPHRCSSCRRPIKVGEKYLRHFSIFEGDTTSEKMCVDCLEDRREFCDAHRIAGFPPSNLQHYLSECIADGDEESDQQWRPMLERLKARRLAWPKGM